MSPKPNTFLKSQSCLVLVSGVKDGVCHLALARTILCLEEGLGTELGLSTLATTTIGGFLVLLQLGHECHLS